MEFSVLTADPHSKARAGRLLTDHGPIATPVFMPVATAGTVKAVPQRDLERDVHAAMILANAYHLYLRPGVTLLEEAKGLHAFMNWKGPILTDSGGYQVYSLAPRRKLEERGATFRSHIDGSAHLFTPERVIDIQRSIGADIVMAFDECTPYPCDYDYASKSMELTHRWLARCATHFAGLSPLYDHKQALFGIVQGSVFADLRVKSAEFVASQDLPGYAIGGLSVGEPHALMYQMTNTVCTVLPCEKPRYLMGVGTPENMLECIALGIDMFDCVMPTRNARNGMLFTSQGIINIRNEKWKRDLTPLDTVLGGHVSAYYSKAYLRHLMICGEMLGAHIASVHNLTFYLWLMKEARKKIQEGAFWAWKNDMVKKISKRV